MAQQNIIAGLVPRLQRVYSHLDWHKRLVQLGDERLIVYAGALDDYATEIVSLLQLGHVEKRRVGKRTVIILGSWEVVERPFAAVAIRKSRLFTDEMAEPLQRYSLSQQRVLERAFLAFAGMRKSRKVSPSVLIQQLALYAKYPVDAVLEGLETYLAGDYADQGKNEKYALGVIRGKAKQGVSRREHTPSAPVQISQALEQLKQTHEVRARRDRERDGRLLELVAAEFGKGVLLASIPLDALRRLSRQAKEEVGV